MPAAISASGIMFDNIRGLTLSVTLSSILAAAAGAEAWLSAAGVVAGIYYGRLMESQINEVRTLGGRIVRCRSWDYLISK